MTELTPDEFEQQWLRGLLYTGESTADSVDQLRLHRRRIEHWVHLMTGQHWPIGHAEPATTDGARLFLPLLVDRTLGPKGVVACLRAMALMQAHSAMTGLWIRKAWAAELHRDWVLKTIAQLLVANWVIRRWDGLGGMQADLQVVFRSARMCTLLVGRSEVARAEVHPLGCALIDPLLGASSSGDGELAFLNDVEPAALPLVIPGAAARLRERFRAERAGAPPAPRWIGAMHPGWFLGDAAAEKEASNRWRSGPAPLRRLLARKAKTEERPHPSSFAVAPTSAVPTEESRVREWDHGSGQYKLDAVHVVRSPARSAGPGPVLAIEAEHRGELRSLQTAFETLQTESRWLHGQPTGSEFDLARLVDAQATIAAGRQPSDRIFRRHQKTAQTLSVLTLIDLSGSAHGAILREQRKALVFFGWALEALGIPFAFIGFQGSGAHDCRLVGIKNFDAPYEEAKGRIGGIEARGGSRIGAHLRAANRLLSRRTESRKALILLSDGKPEDGAAYRGAYGTADTAMAAREVQSEGVVLHCLSMDPTESPHLKTIFGPAGFTQVDGAARLAAALPAAFVGMFR